MDTTETIEDTTMSSTTSDIDNVTEVLQDLTDRPVRTDLEDELSLPLDSQNKDSDVTYEENRPEDFITSILDDSYNQDFSTDAIDSTSATSPTVIPITTSENTAILSKTPDLLENSFLQFEADDDETKLDEGTLHESVLVDLNTDSPSVPEVCTTNEERGVESEEQTDKLLENVVSIDVDQETDNSLDANESSDVKETATEEAQRPVAEDATVVLDDSDDDDDVVEVPIDVAPEETDNPPEETGNIATKTNENQPTEVKSTEVITVIDDTESMDTDNVDDSINAPTEGETPMEVTETGTSPEQVDPPTSTSEDNRDGEQSKSPVSEPDAVVEKPSSTSKDKSADDSCAAPQESEKMDTTPNVTETPLDTSELGSSSETPDKTSDQLEQSDDNTGKVSEQTNDNAIDVDEPVTQSATSICNNIDEGNNEDENTVFEHVDTENEKDTGDKNVPETTSAESQDEENLQGAQPQEDPIGSDDFVSVLMEDDLEESEQVVDEQVDEEQGGSEEMCIIPDTERVISQAEREAAASMVPLRDPTESEFFTSDPSSDGTTAETSLDKRENYFISVCTDENVNACMQCVLPRKSKYSVMHKKVTTFICDEGCLNNFKRRNADKVVMSTEGDLRVKNLTSGVNNDNMVAKLKFYRKCAECQKKLVINDTYLSWETMEFCNELCLSKYQKKVASNCSNCNIAVRNNCLGKYCVRFGYDIRQFCSSMCLEEYKKGLKVCSYCQKDMSSGGGDGFLAPVGDKGQFKDFCTQLCMEKYDVMSNNRGKQAQKAGTKCSVCSNEKPITIEFEHDNKMNLFCGEPCFVAFKFVNNITPAKCDMCKKYFDNKVLEENSMYYDNSLHSFCSKSCQNIYIIGHRKIVPCSWCKVKKYNFDMIKRSASTGSALLMCSLNCLSLYQVSINAVHSKKTKCDHCQKTLQPLYHLTMSDATMRNFCSYPCVMAFQTKFPKTPITLNEPEEAAAVPVPTGGIKKSKRILPAKRTEQVSADVPTIPVISSVQSLATTNGPSSGKSKNSRTKDTSADSTHAPSPPIVKTQIKQHFIIKPAPIPPQRNIGTLCKVNTKTKGVNCIATTCDQEVQTDEIKEKTAVIPIPVPIYVPAPMWMYSMPLPVPFPFPLPVPVPIFIPTTRSSASGIMKEIKKIQIKIPTDPFEAELLMMAEMVAGDKKDEHTDSESEEEDTAPPPEEPPAFSPEPVDASNSFGDDMLQMALKMATELDEPAVDLEGALTANTITSTTQVHEPTTVAPEESTEETQPIHNIMERQAIRGRKRPGRPPKPVVSKRGRRSSTQMDIPIMAPPQPPQPQEPTEKPDANMCLKYTFGVNAWKQWVTTKNAELEKTSRRVKSFKPEILQLTADELNYSLCLFVKEVRKPNGQEYAPDTIYYLCLGIQQYLFENARIDNIFCDSYYEKFTDCLDEVAKKFSVLYNDSHYIVTRVEEEHLWESKQLGAHSPHVLLSTLMFFNTKHFNLTTVDEHMQLSFSHIMKHWKRNPSQPGTSKVAGSRNVLLRFYPPQTNSATDVTQRKKKVYEQQENEDNPLRCPVKLYEFYLSKCPESVKTRNDVFYLLPERSCVPDSPVWYSTMPLPKAALEKMLHRVKMVKEINVALLAS